MLSILLIILKIIGLILLTIIGLVLLILLSVLLVSIRYEAEAAMAEKKPTVKARVSWLLRFMCVRVRYGDDGLHYLIKVCGFTVLDSDKPKDEKPKETKSKKQKPKKKKSSVIEKTLKESDSDKNQPPSVEKPEAAEQNITMKTEVPADVVTEKFEIGTTEEAKGRFGKKKDKKKKEEKQKESEEEKKSLQEKLEDLKTKKDEITAKINDIKAKVDEVLAYLQSPKGRKLLAFLKKKLFRLLRHLKPKKLRINGRIGLADPATTGKILGISYMLYPLYENDIHIVGEFEEEVIEGDFYIKGRIRLGTLLLIAVQIILNKEVRMWIKKLTGGNRK